MDESRGRRRKAGGGTEGITVAKGLKLLRHDLGVAYRGSSLVCQSVTYLAYSLIHYTMSPELT